MNSPNNNTAKRGFRVNQVADYIGVSKTTIWRLIKAGKLPPGIKLSNHCVIWLKEDLDHFLEEAAQN